MKNVIFATVLMFPLFCLESYAYDPYPGIAILKYIPTGQYQGLDSNGQDCFVSVKLFDFSTAKTASLTISRVKPSDQIHPGDTLTFNGSTNSKLVSDDETEQSLDALVQSVPEDEYSGTYRNWISITKADGKVTVEVKSARRFLGTWLSERKRKNCTF